MTAQLFTDLPNEKYHAAKDHLSKSMLADLDDCPARFKHLHLDGGAQDNTQSLRLGTAVHVLALEPSLFNAQHYVLSDDCRRGTKVWAEHEEAADGRTILKASDYAEIKGMADALRKNKKAMLLLEAKGHIEASIFWDDEDSGLQFRCRPDLMRNDGLIVDLKTAATAEPSRFSKVAWDKHYDVSVALTTRGYEALYGKAPSDYMFLVVESKAPYIIEVYSAYAPFDTLAGVSYLDCGKYRLDRLIEKYKECAAADKWPSYSNIIMPMTAPVYALKQMENANG